MGFVRAFAAIRVLACTGLALSAGCTVNDNGPDPPSNALYYPTTAVVSPLGSALYIANSDFDLQYNGGTVQVIDLARVRSMLSPLWNPAWASDPNLCARVGSESHHLAVNTSEVIYPGPCGPLDLVNPVDDGGPLVRSSAKVGAFATQLLYVCQPAAGEVGAGARCEGATATAARLFAVVRGDPSLTYFEVDDDRAGAQSFRLDCGQGSFGARCDAGHRLGTDSTDNPDGLVLPTEPFDLAVSDGAEAIVVTHQTTGSVSLFTSAVDSQARAQLNGSTVFGRPALQRVLTGLPSGSIDVAPLPIPGFAREGIPSDATTGSYRPGFFVSARTSAEMDVVRFYGDSLSAPSRPYFTLARTAAIPISVLSSGSDSRGLVIDRSPRDACEAACGSGADRASCLLACAELSLPVYVANRSPASLLVGETVSTPQEVQGQNYGANLNNELVRFSEAYPLASGASWVVLGAIRGRDGLTHTRVFVVCFDTRTIVVYDPARHAVEGQIRTGRGPQGLVLDPVLPIAYVVHFSDSYVGIADLDESHTATFETMVATVGVPIPPQETK